LFIKFEMTTAQSTVHE